MTSRERVKRAVNFTKPDRIPMTLSGEWGYDIAYASFGADPDFIPSVPGEDEWHCVWQKVSIGDKTMGQPKIHPLEDYSLLETYDFPDYKQEIRYKHIYDIVKNNNESDDPKFMLGGIPASLAHRPEYLRGSLNAWMDPYEYPDEYRNLLDLITKTGEDVVENYARIGGIDGIFFCDDWGLQDRTMISPAHFEEFIAPMYTRLFKKAHDNGIMTFMHSCGHITEFMELLIKSGLDLIQMDQQENMGVDLLAEKFGGRICFWCPVDIQQTMINGTIEDVQNYAKLLIDKFGSFDGGFIAQWYASPQAVNHSWDKINAMCKVFSEYGGKFYD
ncbi:MAG: hypothetical protein FWF15_10885 [Oscillospiraceae bacterium]|nr:hypothetical protein [Oscillospiraceae bacterium]